MSSSSSSGVGPSSASSSGISSGISSRHTLEKLRVERMRLNNLGMASPSELGGSNGGNGSIGRCSSMPPPNEIFSESNESEGKLGQLGQLSSPMTELAANLTDTACIMSPCSESGGINIVDHRRRLSMDSMPNSPATPLTSITNLMPKRNLISSTSKEERRPFSSFSSKFQESNKENVPVSSSPLKRSHSSLKTGVLSKLPKPFENDDHDEVDESSQDSGFFGSSSSTTSSLTHSNSLVESLSRTSVTSIRRTSLDLRSRADTEPLTLLPEVDSPDKRTPSQHCDGFDLNEEDFNLDDASELEVNEPLQQLPATTGVKNPANLSVGTLINNKVLIKPSSISENILKSPNVSESENNSNNSTAKKSKKPMLMHGLTPESSLPSKRTSYRRCLSMLETSNIIPITDLESPVSRISASSVNSFKRPCSPHQESPNLAGTSSDDCNQVIKRRKYYNHSNEVARTPKHHSTSNVTANGSNSTKKLARSMSEITYSACLSAGLSDINLTGDFSRALALPILPSNVQHHDLKPISATTLVNLINGQYTDVIESYRIIDARYSYEYEGGHIINAQNFGSWDEGAFFDEFLNDSKKPVSKPSDPSEKRNILIFHCEFSSARGPELMKKLRQKDRCLNRDTYPALHYPECYLLHKGYKEFFTQYPYLCEPKDYRPMLDPNFKSQEKSFHMKSKSWAGGTVARTGTRSARPLNL